MPSRRRLAFGLLVVLVATVLAGCAGRYGGGNPAPETQVKIVDNAYEPETLTVEVNTTIQWNHRGDNTHTVTFYDGPGNASNISSMDLERGDHFTFTPRKPGTYRYRCQYHSEATAGGYSGMTGRIDVQR